MSATAEKRMGACQPELVSRYMSYESPGIYTVYDVYGIPCLRTMDSESAFRRARLLDGIERMKHAREHA